MDDIYYEYACAYVFYFHMLQKMKETSKVDKNQIENVKSQIEKYTKNMDEKVAKRYGINPELLEKWISREQKDQ